MSRSGEDGFRFRGVVEGYYGQAYDDASRRWLIEQMGRWSMNLYVYAPKDDALNREAWRTPYPAPALDAFAELIAHGDRCGVEVGFAIAPGLSIEYASSDDRGRVLAKLDAFRERGARFFCLALDDVSSQLVHTSDAVAFGSLAHAHAALCSEVLEHLGPECTLWLVPTDYAGPGSSDYLETLGRLLPREIEVGWTGRTVVSPSIHAEEAEARVAALGRRLLIWDNVPVNDGPMRRCLHIGPYVGRGSDLTRVASGVLLNPMEHARASAITIAAAAAYLRAPHEYDAEAAWRSALRERCGAADGPPHEGLLRDFELFAAAHRFSACSPDDRDLELEAAFDALREALGRRDDGAATHGLKALRALVEERATAAERVRAEHQDAELVAELAPWLTSHARESRAMVLAIDCLEALLGGGHALERALAFFKMEGRLTHLETPLAISYGPRRTLYPQLIALDEDAAGFGHDPVLYRDLCLSDAFIELAEQEAKRRLG